MFGDLEVGGPRPRRRWRAEGHRLEVTVSMVGPPCFQQGGCVLGFHMGLRKRGSGTQHLRLPHSSFTHQLWHGQSVPTVRNSFWPTPPFNSSHCTHSSMDTVHLYNLQTNRQTNRLKSLSLVTYGDSGTQRFPH